jgi:predicted Zn-dependent protease
MLAASLRRTALAFGLALLVACGAQASPGPMPGTGGGTGADLPNIGTPADSLLTPSDEYQIGSMIVRQLRDSGLVIEDPDVGEYIQSLGARLAAHAQEGGLKFTFVVMKEPSINAFALPGGFVVVHSGLILASKSESELAGVLSHEISHVTQRHLVRSIQNQGRASLAATAAMLAAIVLGAISGNPNVGMAGVVVGQGSAMQHQLNFSRENEYEADRVGIGVMASAGYDPNAMATFFDTLSHRTPYAGQNAKILEFLQNHPVTTARIAEAKARAANYPIVRPVDTVGYQLTREKLRVLAMSIDADPHDAYADATSPDKVVSEYRLYGRALALMQGSKTAPESVPILRDLVNRHPDIIEYHSALGQALLAAGDIQGSRAALAHAMELFPRSIPITVRYAETLMRDNDARLAHSVLLDLFNSVPPTHEQVRLIALAASAAGEAAEANYYMAEYHVMSGDLALAIQTLRQALAVPNITPMQRSRFKARVDELKEYLPPRLQAAVDRGEPIPTDTPPSGSR